MKIGYYCLNKNKKVKFDKCPCSNPCLPVPVMRALIDSQQPPVPGEWRVSEIIGQPTQVVLRRRKDYYGYPNAELYMLWGTMIHTLLQSYAKGFVAEEQKKTKHKRWIVSGKPDLWIPSEKKLVDYKFANSYILEKLDSEPTHEYVMQLNLYRHLFYPQAKHLEIVVFIRNHTADMNVFPITCKPIPILKKSYITEFLDSRLAELDTLMNMPIKDLPQCPETWGNRRCLLYCDVNQFCFYYKKSIKRRL